MHFDINTLEGFRPTLLCMTHYALVERVTGEWSKAGRLSPERIRSLKKTNIITSSGASTRIEDALMTDEEIRQFVDKGCMLTKLSSRSEREVAGYIRVLNYLYEEGGREDPVSEHSIKAFHQMMTRDFTNEMLPMEQRGAYKNVPNDVVEKNHETGEEKTWFRTVPPGPQTNAAMAELIKVYAQLVHSQIPRPLIVGWFIVHFLAIHPFRDGNGRLSRLLTIWLLLKNGYDWIPYASHEKFIEDNKEAYYVALRQTQQSFLGKVDYDPWLSFFGLILSKQAMYLDEKVLATVGDALASGRKLGKNEQAVFYALSEHAFLSRSELAEKVPMSEKGMKSLLKRLLDKGIIQRTGKGKAVKYSRR